MRIAIQGHPTRGKEVIQILESLGGINRIALRGNSVRSYYYINYISNNLIDCQFEEYINEHYKKYTLEEFEKEFPFKVGDRVVWDKDNYTAVRTVLRIDYSDLAGIKYAITAFGAANCFWEVDVNELKSYKEMKKERNVTLTLEKAKEWYKKGGELKEIALQAFSEQELNPLPKSWEEYCRKHGSICLSTRYTSISSKYDALIKLEQLRDCWRQGWKPNWLDDTEKKYAINSWRNDYSVVITYSTHEFFSFPTYEMAKEFLECFRDLIEQAGDLI